MPEFLSQYGQLFIALAWGSLALFIVSLAVIPWLITKIPIDYFQPQRHEASLKKKRSIASQFFAIIKNLLGIGLIFMGIIMLITPGQGLLTILVGLVLTDFPGKYRMEQRLVAEPKILNSLNWIRAKADKPPLVL